MRIHNSVTDTQDHFVFKHIFFPSLTFEDLWTVFCHCGFSSYFSSAKERDSGQLYDRKTRCRPAAFQFLNSAQVCVSVSPPFSITSRNLGLVLSVRADNNSGGWQQQEHPLLLLTAGRPASSGSGAGEWGLGKMEEHVILASSDGSWQKTRITRRGLWIKELAGKSKGVLDKNGAFVLLMW